MIDRLVVFPPGPCDPARLELRDEAGRAVPFDLLERRRVERFWGIDYRGELDAGAQREKFAVYGEHFRERMRRPETECETTDLFLTIRFQAEELPALGHRIYTLREGAARGERGAAAAASGGDAGDPPARGRTRLAEGAPGEPGVRAEDRAEGHTLGNLFCSLVLHADGTLDLTDRRSGNRFACLNRLEDGEEIGDEYDHGELPAPEIVTSAGCAGSVRLIDATAQRATLEAAFVLELPEAIAPDRRARSRARVACPVRVRVTLTRESPLVEIELEFENRARDHRLRVLFPTGVLSDDILTDGHFLVSSRAVPPPAGAGWVQAPTGTHPQQDFALAQEPGRGLAVLVRGLPEVAAVRGERGGGSTPTSGISARIDAGGAQPAGQAALTAAGQVESGEVGLAVTLLRCVGWLSRDDFAQRPMNAGPTLFTPEAQCQGLQRFHYALLPFGGDWLAADVKGVAQLYRTPPLVRQGVAALARPGGAGLVEQTGRRTCITAIKKHEERETLIVRLYNLASRESRERLLFGRPLRGGWRVDLLEERVAPLPLDPGHESALDLLLRPHEILTLELEFEGEPPPAGTSPGGPR